MHPRLAERPEKAPLRLLLVQALVSSPVEGVGPGSPYPCSRVRANCFLWLGAEANHDLNDSTRDKSYTCKTLARLYTLHCLRTLFTRGSRGFFYVPKPAEQVQNIHKLQTYRLLATYTSGAYTRVPAAYTWICLACWEYFSTASLHRLPRFGLGLLCIYPPALSCQPLRLVLQCFRALQSLLFTYPCRPPGPRFLLALAERLSKLFLLACCVA